MLLINKVFFSISPGYFLKIDSSQGRPGDIADVQTPMFPSSHGVCYVRFFYYMYGGQHIGPLRVCTPFNLLYTVQIVLNAHTLINTPLFGCQKWPFHQCVLEFQEPLINANFKIVGEYPIFLSGNYLTLLFYHVHKSSCFLL